MAVSSKFLDKALASLDTTAKFPEAAAISPSENGTLAAKVFNTSKALAPSSADPNKNLNLNCNDSTSLPTSTKPLTSLPTPRAAKATPAIFNADPSLDDELAVLPND